VRWRDLPNEFTIFMILEPPCYPLVMRLISWNVNGLRSVHGKGLFSPFVTQHDPDILCLQETKAMQGQAEIDLPQYEEYWNSAQKKGYAGTAIFAKKENLPTEVVMGIPEDLCDKYGLKDRFGDANSEGRVIAAKLKGFWVVTVYTPNSKPDLARLEFRHKHWDPAFLEYMKRLEKSAPVAFCGDLNVAHSPDDLANPKANEGEHGFTKEEREGIDKVVKVGFVDTFRHFTPEGNGHYTYWAPWRGLRERNMGWRIDYWFVSKKLLPRVTKAAILSKVMGSDHCPVLLELNK
jgi:exodeoxyribonuclease-3